MALLRGRERPAPQDVYDVAYDILNARLALSYRALAEGFTIDDVLVELLTTVPAPGHGRQWSASARSPRRLRRRTPKPGHLPAPSRSRDATDRPAGRPTGRGMTSAPGCRSRPAGPAPPASSSRSATRSSAAATAVIRRWCSATVSSPERLDRTSRATTSVAWTGRSLPGPASPTSATRSRSATSTSPSWSIGPAASTSGPPAGGRPIWPSAVASAVSELAILGGDRIGAVMATADGPRIVPIRGGRRHLTALMGSVARSPLGGQVDLGRAIDGLRHVLRRRGLAIVVSDFIAPHRHLEAGAWRGSGAEARSSPSRSSTRASSDCPTSACS